MKPLFFDFVIRLSVNGSSSLLPFFPSFLPFFPSLLLFFPSSFLPSFSFLILLPCFFLLLLLPSFFLLHSSFFFLRRFFVKICLRCVGSACLTSQEVMEPMSMRGPLAENDARSKIRPVRRCWHGAECQWLAQQRCLFMHTGQEQRERRVPLRKEDQDIFRFIEETRAGHPPVSLNNVGARFRPNGRCAGHSTRMRLSTNLGAV